MDTTAVRYVIMSEQTLIDFGTRSAGYDRENRFFGEDFRELKDAGYLIIAVPREFGGRALHLAEGCWQQRRLHITRQPRRSASTRMSIGRGRPRISGAAATSRCNGCWKRLPSGRYSPWGTPSAATTFLCCLRQAPPSWSMAVFASPATRCSAISHRFGPATGCTRCGITARPDQKPSRAPAARQRRLPYC